jgi:hypothetical protein
LRQYYRYGDVSDCREFWDAFYNCLKKWTAFANQVTSVNARFTPLALASPPMVVSIALIADSQEEIANHVLLSLRIESSCVAARQVAEGPKPEPMWKLRKKEEAQKAWDWEFGHLSAQGGTARAQPQSNHQPGFVASHNNYQSPAFARATEALAGPTPTPEQSRLSPRVGPADGSPG